MKMGILKYIFTLSLLFWFEILHAQDPQLSQFYASPVFTNPAFAGSERKVRVVSSVRNQYTALKNNFKTTVFSLDGYSQKFNSGLGLLATYDLAGDGLLQTIHISGIYSFNMKLSRRWNISAALQGSMVQRRFDASRLMFGDQLNEMAGYSGMPSADLQNLIARGRVFSNFSSGVLAYNKKFFGGIALHNMFEPNQSFVDVNSTKPELLLARRYTMHAGYTIYFSKARYQDDKWMLSPNLLFMQQQNYYQINMGMYAKKQALTIGAWLRQTSRNSDALILLMGIKLPVFRIGYSYDITISKSRTAMGGSHEISLAFLFNTNRRYATHRSKYLSCPDL